MHIVTPLRQDSFLITNNGCVQLRLVTVTSFAEAKGKKTAIWRGLP